MARPFLGVLAIACLTTAGATARAVAQEPIAPADTAPLPVPEKRPIHQFRLGLGVSAFAWDGDAAAEDGLLVAFGVERDLASWLAARAGLSYGTTELGGAGAAPERAVDTRLYLPEVSLFLQPRFGPLRESRVVPYAMLAFGSLVTDPDRPDVRTRSQNALGYGLGARIGLGDRVGVRGEVQRYLIKLEDPFETMPSESRSIHNTRIGGSLSYAL